jgi:hypothetical protein
LASALGSSAPGALPLGRLSALCRRDLGGGRQRVSVMFIIRFCTLFNIIVTT